MQFQSDEEGWGKDKKKILMRGLIRNQKKEFNVIAKNITWGLKKKKKWKKSKTKWAKSI